jgi:predicted flap endonuclease-1-like 5' DNA nuclease
MSTFTTNQWAIIGLVLVLGWLLGLLSRSGGGKWRRAYETERSDHIAARAAHDARLTAANARVAELERNLAARPAAVAPVATGVGRQDDLALIRGIGRSGASRLHELGIHDYADLTRLSVQDEAALEDRIGAEPGTIERERWREQAEMLAAGRLDEHRRLYS